LTALKRRILFKFTICLKFQLTNTSALAIVAMAIWRASDKLDSATAPSCMYKPANLIDSSSNESCSVESGNNSFSRFFTLAGASSNSSCSKSEMRAIFFFVTNSFQSCFDGVSYSLSKQPPITDVSIYQYRLLQSFYFAFLINCCNDI
jgi:hypothetical protein